MAPDTSAIAPYAATPLDEITARIQTLRTTFKSGRTKDVNFRIRQIRKLYWAIHDNRTLLQEALARDLGRSNYESDICDIDWCLEECCLHSDNILDWVKDEKIPNTPLHVVPMNVRMRSEPFGTVLVISTFNFPIQLAFAPLFGAISAGNTAVLKPSELAPCAAMVMKKIMEEALDPECYVCINGPADVSKHILEHKFDKILFTGGSKIGSIIARKAAETMTPVVLELGGLNPAFVTKNADVKLAARRLLFQKTLNAGQLCLSHNYALVERSAVNLFVQGLKDAYKTFMPEGAQKSPDYTRIVNKDHFRRMKKMIDDSNGKVVIGGSMDESDLFIEPTVVLVDNIKDSLIVEEGFGPIWPIMPFDSLDQAIDIANTVDPTPLGLYAFGTDEECNKVLKNVTSGGATVNDGFFHGMLNTGPLGGVGTSGQGIYRGKYSFKTFSHQRCIAKVPGWVDRLLRPRYMPYSRKELAFFRLYTEKKPNFDREGNVVKGLGYWLAFIFTLGAKRAAAGAFRWALLIMVITMYKLKGQKLGLPLA